MKIKLAGYNLDKQILDQAEFKEISKECLTPETIVAAYARISRSTSSVDELRKQAILDVEKAKKSNRTILYGYGHSSIAENAVLNFDVIGASRLAVEAIQHSRLCSYIEKSQRYQRLTDDFVVPKEIVDLRCVKKFKALIKLQNETYFKLLDKLKKFYLKDVKSVKKVQRTILINKAKEDARYITSLSMESQMGMTLNARNLETMIRRLASHPLHEVREVSRQLYNESKTLIPSLIKYVEPERNNKNFQKALCDISGLLTQNKKNGNSAEYKLTPSLVHWTFNGDILLVATILFHTTHHCWLSCYDLAKQFTEEEKKTIVRTSLKHLSMYDSIPRLFEIVTFTYDLAASATCFAQIKRHRMATLLTKPYDISLGITVPESIYEVDMKNEFITVAGESEELYHCIADKNADVAEYCLTQSHMRRVLMKLNARELYHFARLRKDLHAQWDIRDVANQMVSLAYEKLPLTMMLACGRHEFQHIMEKVYGESYEEKR
ncbi:MAG: FAD-dependent thymidylate synthase [Ignavibacteria bacterium]|nr:FAD-dependent thymidylate synthase [Ignavibacteria bacterium]